MAGAGKRIFEGLGPGTLIPQRGKLPGIDTSIGAEEGFVLSRVDGHTSLDQILLLVPFDEPVTMVILRRLWERGAIEVPGVARSITPKKERTPDPVLVPTPDQSCAMVVCSSVRAPPSDLPRSFTSLKSAAYRALDFTSLKSAAYRALVSDGGGDGRNCVAESSASGAAGWRCVNVAAALAGGVGCHRPGRGGSA